MAYRVLLVEDDNQIREVFGLEGTPTRYIIRERGDEKNG